MPTDQCDGVRSSTEISSPKYVKLTTEISRHTEDAEVLGYIPALHKTECVLHAYNPGLGRQESTDLRVIFRYERQASLGYRRPCRKTTTESSRSDVCPPCPSL